ncbi:MAG: polysaccharide deacetylase family protein, partial [Candidatus Moraniibacteriota bacterium]
MFGVAYNAKSKPKVILTFDDGWQDTYTNAYRIMEPYGFKGVTYAVSDFAQGNDPNYMRKSTLDALYAAGWDVSNHSKHHENYNITPGADALAMKASYQVCLDYLLGCGYERSARFLCYPNGGFDDELIQYIKEIGIISARTTRIGLNPPLPFDVYKMKQVTIGPVTTFGVDTSSNDMKASIDRAVASGQALAVMMHRVSLDAEMETPGDITNSIKTSETMLT